LCEPIEPPAELPPGALSLPEFDPKASTRIRYERKVEAEQCRGCHGLFSPYGYALEAFDALGRYRSEERLLDDAGEYRGKTPILAKVVARVDSGKSVGLDGPVALSGALAESRMASECFARQYFRFTFRREETAADGCAVSALVHTLEATGLSGVYRDVAFTHAFRHRPSGENEGPL
jgi:hypothetical protein